MDTLTIAALTVFTLIGGFMGFIIGIRTNMPFIGVLRIIKESDEKDIYRFEFKEVDKLDEKKYAVMLIKTQSK